MIYKDYKLLPSYVALKQELEAYPNFLKYINYRFDELELKYTDSLFTNYFLAILMQNNFLLVNSEAQFNLITAWTLEDFTTQNITNSTNTGTMINDNTTSYTGYNVSGDFQKANAQGNSTNTAKATATTFEKFTALVRLNLTSIEKLWDKVIGNIISDLFITTYAII